MIIPCPHCFAAAKVLVSRVSGHVQQRGGMFICPVLYLSNMRYHNGLKSFIFGTFFPKGDEIVFLN